MNVEDVAVSINNPQIIYYGPHPCDLCGTVIVRGSIEQGFGLMRLDYPDEAIYPNHKWTEHVCSSKPAANYIPTVSEALESANGLCRSAHGIAKRRGEKTNWEAFEMQLMKSLELQHRVMYPPNEFHTVDAALKETLNRVQRAAELIATARANSGPPANPPSKLWSALINVWEHLDTLQQAIADGEYTEKGINDAATS